MKIDVDQFYYEIYFKKCYLINDKKEIIYYDLKKSIVIAKLDKPYSLKDKIIFFNNDKINDFVPISDGKIWIIYSIENAKFILIKSLKNNDFYEIPIIHNYYSNLQVKFFKEKNQLIIIDYKTLYFWKFKENIQTYQFSSKLSFEQDFVFNILNKKTFIISTNDCLILYNANTLNIQKKIYYDDEEID